jgi:hypothetical protein
MIFRSANGELIQINRYDFKNDKMYHEKILEIKKQINIKMQSTKLDYLTKLSK